MRNAITLRCLLVVVFAACTGEVGGTGEPSVTHSDIQMVVAAKALSLSVGDAKLVNATVSTTPGRASRCGGPSATERCVREFRRC